MSVSIQSAARQIQAPVSEVTTEQLALIDARNADYRKAIQKTGALIIGVEQRPAGGLNITVADKGRKYSQSVLLNNQPTEPDALNEAAIAVVLDARSLDIRKTIQTTGAIIVSVEEVRGGGLEVTLADKDKKILRPVLLSSQFTDIGNLREAGIAVVTWREPTDEKNAASARVVREPVTDAKLLALVDAVDPQIRIEIANAGLIIAEVKRRSGDINEPTIVIADPEGKAEAPPLRLDLADEMGRLREAIENTKTRARSSEGKLVTPVPAIFLERAAELGVQIEGNPERVMGNNFRLVIQGIQSPNITVNFEYEDGNPNTKKIAEFEKYARQVAKDSIKAAAEKAAKDNATDLTPRTPYVPPKPEDIGAEFHAIAETHGITFDHLVREGGHIKVTLKPTPQTSTIRGESLEFVGKSRDFVFKGNDQIKRFGKTVQAVAASVGLDIAEAQKPEKSRALSGTLDNPNAAKKAADQALPPLEPGKPHYRISSDGVLTVSIPAFAFEKRKSIGEFRDIARGIVAAANERFAEQAQKVREARAAAKAAAEAPPVDLTLPERIEGVPEIYYTIAEEVGVTIHTPIRNRDRSIKDVRLSEKEHEIKVGEGPNEKTYACDAGLMKTPYIFGLTKDLENPEQVLRFRQAAVRVRDSAISQRKDTAAWAIRNNKQDALGMTLIVRDAVDALPIVVPEPAPVVQPRRRRAPVKEKAAG